MGLPLYLLVLVFCILKIHPMLGITTKFKAINLLLFSPDIRNLVMIPEQREYEIIGMGQTKIYMYVVMLPLLHQFSSQYLP